jgi:nicotinamide mononucleotide (NMN) deamidase PncC
VTILSQQELVESIHAAARPLVLAITGGGTAAIAALLEVPGGSATLLEAVVPYSSAALEDWLGGPVDHYCSERTARAMAMAAFERARSLSDAPATMLLGVGATASLVSNRPKFGPHRAHIAWQSATATAVASSELVKGDRTREQEERLTSELILNAVAEACGIEGSLKADSHEEPITRRNKTAPPAWTELILGERTHVAVPDSAANASPNVLFPGAFNPIHSAHRRMAEFATKRLGKPVTFELSVTNVDKPPLDYLEIADRLSQFAGEHVLLTRAPRFVEKARLAQGCKFLVGSDTIFRIADAKYYIGGVEQRDAAIAAIAAARCRFLVFGRLVNSAFCSLASASIPPELRKLCDEVPESEFREDISSTKLRGL